MTLAHLKPHRSSAYLAYVRSRPCTVTGYEGEGVVAHHVRCLGGGGTGLKPSDYLCLPLTAEEHSKLHAKGEKRYWKSHGINPEDEILMTLLIFLASPDFRNKADARTMICHLTDVAESFRSETARASKRPKAQPKRKRLESATQSAEP